MTRLRGASTGALFHQLERLFGRGTSVGSSESELLERFVTEKDDAAFEALIARHGRMVLGVCRQMLRDPNDVDDAFQATFLVLVRKAGTFAGLTCSQTGCTALPTVWRPAPICIRKACRSPCLR